jgi:molybdopterin-guanine dinucleotide biosynthesis protein A
MIKKAAIVLAGGKSQRFQTNKSPWQDKTLAILHGKPLLVYAVQEVSNIVEEIAVCVNDEERKIKYSKILAQYGIENVRLIVDEKIDNLGGPLVAILTGLKFIQAENCFTLPGDMPFLAPAMIEYMFKKGEKYPVVVPMWPNGRLETLTMVLEKITALQIATTLCQLQRPRSDDLIRGAQKACFLSITGKIKSIDPELRSFVNINAPEDLLHLKPRRSEGNRNHDIYIDRGKLPNQKLNNLRKAATLRKANEYSQAAEIFSICAKELEAEAPFWAGVSYENEGKSYLDLYKTQKTTEHNVELLSKVKMSLTKASSQYELEATMYQEYGCAFLADRANSDKQWCETQIKSLL